VRETKVPTRVRVEGHYEVFEEGPARDYVWVPGEEMVEAEEVEERLHPWHEEDERQKTERRENPEWQYWLELAAL
jgi:hypothetical protein